MGDEALARIQDQVTASLRPEERGMPGRYEGVLEEAIALWEESGHPQTLSEEQLVAAYLRASRREAERLTQQLRARLERGLPEGKRASLEGVADGFERANALMPGEEIDAAGLEALARQMAAEIARIAPRREEEE